MAVADIVGPRVLAQTAVAAPITGTLTETVLGTITVPAGAIGPNGQVEINAHFSVTNSANTKTVRVKFGGTTFFSLNLSASAAIQAYSRICNRNSAASQIAYGGTNGFGTTTTANATGTVDTSGEVTIQLTGQLTNTGETITLESYTVVVSPKV